MLKLEMLKNVDTLKWFNFSTDFILYSPVAILYFTMISGSFALGMSIFSLSMLSTALLEIPTGVFSDKIGRKKTITLGAVAAIIYSLFFAIGGSYIFLAIGAIIQGLSRALYSGNNDGLLYERLL